MQRVNGLPDDHRINGRPSFFKTIYIVKSWKLKGQSIRIARMGKATAPGLPLVFA